MILPSMGKLQRKHHLMVEKIKENETIFYVLQNVQEREGLDKIMTHLYAYNNH